MWGAVWPFVAPIPPPPALTRLSPGKGKVGSPVTISGTNLADATGVSFNGTDATFSVGSDAQITATVPAGATSGRVTVATAGGTATSKKVFKVTKK